MLIILILANDNELYLKCQELWKIYMNTKPNVKSIFIKKIYFQIIYFLLIHFLEIIL
jgi:hypothetical protein